MGQFLAKLTSGDTLVKFRTWPSSSPEAFSVRLGYAIIRDGHCVERYIVDYQGNPAYYEDVEEVVELEQFARSHPALWEELRADYQAGDTIVHFRTSPMSWASLYGREGYAIKRKGEYVRTHVTILN